MVLVQEGRFQLALAWRGDPQPPLEHDGRFQLALVLGGSSQLVILAWECGRCLYWGIQVCHLWHLGKIHASSSCLVLCSFQLNANSHRCHSHRVVAKAIPKS